MVFVLQGFSQFPVLGPSSDFTNIKKTDVFVLTASEKVVAKFNTAGKPNKQVKTITLFTNTAKGREILKIKGNVTPKAK